MHVSVNPSELILPLVAFAVLILVFALLQPRRRRRRSQGERHKKRNWFAIHIDHGRRIARKHGHERSSEWSRVEKEHRLREPACIACGHKGKGLQVHHIKPFHLHPQLELDPNNLITLCERPSKKHHLLIGHLGQWKSYNEQVRHDAKRLYGKTARQIKADATWQKKMKQRP